MVKLVHIVVAKSIRHSTARREKIHRKGRPVVEGALPSATQFEQIFVEIEGQADNCLRGGMTIVVYQRSQGSFLRHTGFGRIVIRDVSYAVRNQVSRERLGAGEERLARGEAC